MKEKANAFTLDFNEVGIEDVSLVGGKNASLGEMTRTLVSAGVPVPFGFAITAYAYRYFLEQTGLKAKLHSILDGLDTHNIADLQARGKASRELLSTAELPADLRKDIKEAYKKLCGNEKNIKVAVRSSATAEDLPDASFAGQ